MNLKSDTVAKLASTHTTVRPPCDDVASSLDLTCLLFATVLLYVAVFQWCSRDAEPCCFVGAASGSADADKKEKAPKGGTAVKVRRI